MEPERGLDETAVLTDDRGAPNWTLQLTGPAPALGTRRVGEPAPQLNALAVRSTDARGLQCRRWLLPPTETP